MHPTQFLGMRPTRQLMRPMPKEEHSAHTISQRLRTLRKIPPELIPLGVVMGVAIFAAGYSMIRKLYTDKTLRLSRSGGISHRDTSDTKKGHGGHGPKAQEG